MLQQFFSAAAIVLTFALYFPYILSIQRGHIKPHVFSWVIWGLGTLIVFFAQWAGGAGWGAWPIGVSGLITCYVALLAYWKRGDTLATSSDWIFFVVALLALPCWLFTSDPLWAVVILTLVDTIGFGPTVRKAYFAPHEESVNLFALTTLRNGLTILALEKFSLTTVLFPAVVGVTCLLVVLMLVYRRRRVV